MAPEPLKKIDHSLFGHVTDNFEITQDAAWNYLWFLKGHRPDTLYVDGKQFDEVTAQELDSYINYLEGELETGAYFPKSL